MTKNQKNVVVTVEVFDTLNEATEALSQGKVKPGSQVTNEKAAKVISSTLVPYTEEGKGKPVRILLVKSILVVAYQKPKSGIRVDFVYMPEFDNSNAVAIIGEDYSHVS